VGFVKEWNKAIVADPYWQFEELLEEAPESAESEWYLTTIAILTSNRLARRGIYIPPEEIWDLYLEGFCIDESRIGGKK
jgi:hypothetical protein